MFLHVAIFARLAKVEGATPTPAWRNEHRAKAA
jgi:hypothetical protein